jgi:hypothetical protein
VIDIVHGLNEYLSQDPGIMALPVIGVYDVALPVEVDIEMPAKAVVIKPHGGPVDPGPLYVNYSQVAIQCFGETDHLSYIVEETVFLALKAFTSSVWANTYIYNVIRSSGPTSGRNPVGGTTTAQAYQWPYNTAVFRVMASDLTIS